MSWKSSPASETISLSLNMGQCGSVRRLNSHLFRYEEFTWGSMFLLEEGGQGSGLIGKNCDSVCLLKHLQISLLHSNAVHRPVKVELWVRDAVFDQHGEVFCCSQQRMPVGTWNDTSSLHNTATSNKYSNMVNVLLLRQLSVYFKWAPWEHFTGPCSGGVVLTQSRLYTWVENYFHAEFLVREATNIKGAVSSGRKAYRCPGDHCVPRHSCSHPHK